MKYRIACAMLFLLAGLATISLGHSGGTDSKGGHYNRKTGVYHSHRAKPVRTTTTSVKSKSTSTSKYSKKQTLTHWMTLSSSKRHNKSCRYFMNSKGRMSKPTEGIACKICGG